MLLTIRQRTLLRTIATGICLLLVSTVLLACAESTEESLTKPITSQTRNGIKLSMYAPTTNPNYTIFRFTMDLPQEVIDSDTARPWAPFTTPGNVTLVGINVPPGELQVDADPHLKGEQEQEFTLSLPGVSDPKAGASITFNSIPFKVGETDLTVQGPWEFTVTPEMVGDFDGFLITPIEASAAADGVTLTIDQIVQTVNLIEMQFTLDPGEFTSIYLEALAMQVVTADTTLQAEQVEFPEWGERRSGNPIGVTVTFPLRDATLTDARFEITSMMAEKAAPVSITIQHPLSDWSADPLTIGDNTIEVTDVAYDERMADIKITARNVSPADQATVVLFADQWSVTLTDNKGRDVPNVSVASAARNKTDGSAAGVESSGQFMGVYPDTTSVTLAFTSYGEMLRGPWVVQLTAP